MAGRYLDIRGCGDAARAEVNRHSAAFAVALLAGCTAPSQLGSETPLASAPLNGRPDANVIAPPHRHSMALPLPPAVRRGLRARHVSGYIFATDYARNKVDRWKTISQPDGSEPSRWYSEVSEPQGLGEADGSLWIANTNASNILELDAAGKLSKTLKDPREFPVNLALTRKKKLYVANIFSTSFGAGNVAYYANDDGTDLKPTGLLSNSTFYQVIGIAVDGAGDVFVNNNTQDFAGGEVVEFKGGRGNGTVLTNIAVEVAGGLAIDPKTKDLLVVDQGADRSGATVSVYAAPYTGSAIKTYLFPEIVDIALDANSSNIYCANVNGYVDVYGYPSGSFEGSYADVLEPIGVAVQPAAIP
jgi:hypothetical protein